MIPTKMCKCFKCQDQGHIASKYPIKRTMFVEENEGNEMEEWGGNWSRISTVRENFSRW